MKGTKARFLAVALLAVVFTVFAGDDDVTSGRTDSDKSVVVPAKPKVDAAKPKRDQAKPEVDQAGPARASEAHAEPRAVQAPAAPEPEEPRVIPSPSVRSAPGGAGELEHPPRGGQGGGRGGHGNGGYGGGHRHGGDWGWRGGHHDEWRHRNYHGSWSFLWYHGPVIFPAPVYVPHVIRIPHDRVGVYVRQTGNDYVGMAFANSVREHLSERGLRVVYSEDDARLELYLVSMEQDPEDAGYGSAVSVSYIWSPGNRFITAQMLDVGVDEVADLALSVAGYADDLVDDYR
jgi:hypothetical protein